jgi:hypothetical protein
MPFDGSTNTKELFLRALREGEYSQITGSLHREGSFCALGVLFKLLGATPSGESMTFSKKPEAHKVCLNNLDEILWDSFGAVRSQIINMNDRMKLSFSEIADRLENGNLPMIEKGTGYYAF